MLQLDVSMFLCATGVIIAAAMLCYTIIRHIMRDIFLVHLPKKRLLWQAHREGVWSGERERESENNIEKD